MRVSYNRKAGLALDADLALLFVDGGRLIQNAELLRPTRDARCGVAQTYVRRGVTQTRVATELLRLASAMGRGVPQTRVRRRVPQTYV